MLSDTISRLSCLRCAHEWFPRKDGVPVRCPACKSPYWNRRRRRDAAQPDANDRFELGKRYFAQHADALAKRYAGRYVAVGADGVADSDADFSALADRVFEKFGTAPMLIRKVEPKPRAIRVRERLRVRHRTV